MRNEEARFCKIFRAVFACETERLSEAVGGPTSACQTREAEARAGEQSEQ